MNEVNQSPHRFHSHINHHLTLNFDDPSSGQAVQIAFGFFQGEPTAAVFVGDADEPILIPRDALLVAAHQGWDTYCPECEHEND